MRFTAIEANMITNFMKTLAELKRNHPEVDFLCDSATKDLTELRQIIIDELNA